MIAPMPFFEDRGAPIRVYGEAKGLTKLGHRVDVVCYHLGREIPEAIKIQRIIRIPWYRRIVAGPTYHKAYLDILLLFKALNVVRGNSFDILHAHLHEGAALAQILNLLFKINKPVIFDAQGSLTGEMMAHGFIEPSSFMFRFWRLVESKICDGSGLILASSPHLIEMLRKEFGISKEKIKYVPDGVDTDLFDPDRFNGEEIRRKYKLGDNKIVIYTGIFSKYQGLNFLIEEVIPYVVKERRDTRFVLVGYPVDEYRKLSRRVGLEEYIVFAGKQRLDEIPRFLVAADIAVTPKFMEMGEANLKILTYMAMGLPTVSFDYMYNKQMLRGSGLTTRPGDAEEFAEAILKLLDNPKENKVMGQRARAIAQNEYSWLSTARKIEEIYSNVT
jgi:glycosyltransferase involved in cell wall biosynthesis